VLHPTARLQPPVYLGEDCDIGPRARLGPHVVLGNGCVLDESSVAENAAILPGSYVGEALHLDGVVVDRNRLVNVGLGTTVEIADDFILGSMAHRSFGSVGQWLSQAAGVVLLFLTWPVLLATALILKLARSGPVLYRHEVVRLPAVARGDSWATIRLWSFAPDLAPRPSAWGNFVLRFLPALLNVVRGEFRLVGVLPRDAASVRALPHDWRTLYLQAKAGIVTEAWLLYGDRPTDDERYSSEAFYSVAAGPWHDARLLARFALRLLGLRRAPTIEPEAAEEAVASAAVAVGRPENASSTR
jgi:lipopolysaccharide/colanic/teichoic acid biosynthesis glycosyltransferase